MHPVVLLDGLALAGWSGALVGLLVRQRREWPNRVCWILLGFIVSSLCYATCIFIEWAGAVTQLEDVENLIGVTLPIWWAFAIYAMAQHLVRRDLARSEERLQVALAGAELGTWDWNIRNGRMVYNERWAAMLGYALDEIEPTVEQWRRLVHPDDLAVAESALQAHLDGQTSVYQSEHRLQHKSGAWIWVLDKGRVIERDARGTPVRAAGTHLDVTVHRRTEEEHRELEGQLRQAQKLEAIGQLAGGVAHDFNNILTAILGTVELEMAALNQGDMTKESLRESLAQIEKGAQRASSLTRQLLALARRQMIQPVNLKINDVVANLEGMLRRILPENIALDMLLAEDLESVCGDAGQLEQVLVNLAVNAADAMPDGGRLTIETRNVVLDARYVAMHADAQLGPHVMLAVSDTGTGISPKARERIFEPFFTTKPPGKGTGLGLATVYGIVKQAGGHLGVYSEPMQGATFRVYLPVAVAAADSEVSASGPQGDEGLVGRSEPAKRVRTLLLCEDDAGVRTLAMRLLESAGYVVLAAECGKDALAAVARHDGPIDLLISDVVMPDMNGREVSEALRARGVHVPTLFMSGYTASIIAHHGVVDEGVEFLEKPFTAVQLLSRIRDLLAQADSASAGPGESAEADRSQG